MKLCKYTTPTAITILFLLVSINLSVAQTEPPCGNIIGPEEHTELNSPTTTIAIIDCHNPFGVPSAEVNPFSMEINGNVVQPDSTFTVPTGGTNDYSFDNTGNLYGDFVGTEHLLYKKIGNDYIYIKSPFALMRNDYELLADQFFPTETDYTLYVDIILNQYDPYEYLPTFEEADQYYLFEDFVSLNIDSVTKYPKLTAGEYVVVRPVYVFGSSFDEKSLFKKLFAFILPKIAHAQFAPNPSYLFITRFTIIEQVVEPTGASSVLFLPGIQASKLYKDGLLGFEDQIWTPDALFNNDIYNLSMSTNGVSDNNVYTRDILSSIPSGGNVYRDFSVFMNQLDSENKIESWKSFAYDWRYSVKDIANSGTRYEDGIKDAIDEIEILATNSFTDKVTIIGHSNGGLLAKAIMMRLEVEGKSSLVDKVILLASPQLGTPKAIGTILHGYDQTDAVGGFIMDGQIVRRVLNNMPGAYGLLPSEKYFNGLSEPLIVFNDNSSTLPYRNIYGSSISNYDDMVRYVKGEDGLDRGLENPISKPARSNIGLLDQALIDHNNLDNWVAPPGVEVIEIVGTGLPTMKAVEYREITETKCASAGPAGPVCTNESEIKPYARLTHYGDSTVVQRSAEAYEGEKRKFFVNLDILNDTIVGNKLYHHNISEAQPVQDLLSSLIVGTTTVSNEFISANHTIFNDPYDVEIIDSPVRLLATDTQGNQTGVVLVNGERRVKQEIPGSLYFEFGDTKYFVVPKGTDRTTKLYGEANGGYSLTLATFGANDMQTINSVLKNATTTPTLVAEYKNTNNQYSTVTSDLNGDGTIDLETTLSGVVIPQITYTSLIAKIQAVTLAGLYKRSLVLIIKSAEDFSKKTTQRTISKKIEIGLLKTTEELVKLYIKKGYLTATDGQAILQMITVLKNKP